MSTKSVIIGLSAAVLVCIVVTAYAAIVDSKKEGMVEW